MRERAGREILTHTRARARASWILPDLPHLPPKAGSRNRPGRCPDPAEQWQPPLVAPRPYSRHAPGRAWGKSHLPPASARPHAPSQVPIGPPGLGAAGLGWDHLAETRLIPWPGGAGSRKPGGEGAPGGRRPCGAAPGNRRCSPGRGRAGQTPHSPDVASRRRDGGRRSGQRPLPGRRPELQPSGEGARALPPADDLPGRPATPSPGPAHLPLRRLQPHGRCRRQGLTRGLRPALLRGRCGEGRAGREGRAPVPPAHSPGPAPPAVPPASGRPPGSKETPGLERSG